MDSAGIVYLVSDRIGGNVELARAIGRRFACVGVGPGVRWDGAERPAGFVVDVSLRHPANLRCVSAALERFGQDRPPLVALLRAEDLQGTSLAASLGATACLPASASIGTIMDCLLREVSAVPSAAAGPVSLAATRADKAFATMFLSAREDGRVTHEEISAGIAPVLAGVAYGGVDRWLETVRAHDDVTYQHCLSVAGLAAGFGMGLGLSRSDRERFVRAALAHDVGKALIPLEILSKPGKLDPSELSVMRTHPALGHDILMAGGVSDPEILASVRHHHEVLDGTGYPDGIGGGDIPDIVRLLTICDIYSALIERRPYKEPMAPRDAIGVLSSMRGKLEPALVDAFAGVVLLVPKAA
jgi:HD-GYP domain-containing protein (c-di-GMP phosphodiesterase class II)